MHPFLSFLTPAHIAAMKADTEAELRKDGAAILGDPARREKLASAIATGIVVVVHLLGIPVLPSAFPLIVKDAAHWLIDDVAQAIGAMPKPPEIG
jgi:dTDP-4-amino-4,6-dideoxygalactose transaminase